MKEKKSWISKSNNCFPTLDSAVSIRVWGFPIAMLLVSAQPKLASSTRPQQKGFASELGQDADWW